MSGLNRWQGFLTLGADAELRYTQGGQPVLNFRGACNETFKDREGNKKETTTWVPCVLWGPRGEALANHLVKATKVYVEGALRIGTYEKDGEKRTKVEINVTEIEFAGGRGRSDGASQESGPPRGGQRQGHGAGGGGYGGSSGRRAPPPPADAGDDGFGGGYPGGSDDDIPFSDSGMSHDLRRWGL